MQQDVSEDWDVVVVGGGIAGLSAGVRAAELGLRSLVVEKGEDPAYLCNSRISGGVFHVAHEDIRKPPPVLFEAIDRSTHGYADPGLARTLVEEAGETIAWLTAQGGRFINAGAHAKYTAMAAPPRPLDDTLDWLTSWSGRGPDLLLRALAQRLDAHGGMLLLGTRASELIMEQGRCVGLRAERQGNGFLFRARAVVLCDGGFAGDAARIAGSITPRPDRIVQRNAGVATGDGIRMAEAAGAGLTALDGFYGHVLSRDALTNGRLWPYPLLDELCVRGIVVDGAGQRFCDEGVGGVYVANKIAALPDPLATFVICDEAIWTDIRARAHVSVPNPKLSELGGTIHRSDTLEDLAERAGLPPDALRNAVETHNRAVASGDWSGAAPARSTDRHAPRPILQAPFLAIPACAGITFTLGGIRIDADARVLNGEGKVIEGLYAAGSSTGGLEGGPYSAYVSGLSKAAVFGKHAAEHIAASIAPQTVAASVPPSFPTGEQRQNRRYPALSFIVRHGAALAIGAACLPLVGTLWAIVAMPHWIVALSAGGVAASALTFLLARSYIELVDVIVEMLLPH